MTAAPDSFDPYAAPAPADLRGRAVRLATAAAVLSGLLSNPPTPLLAEQLHDGALTDMWPLRDEASLRGARALAAAAHESDLAQTAEWRDLLGPTAPTRPVLSSLVGRGAAGVTAGFPGSASAAPAADAASAVRDGGTAGATRAPIVPAPPHLRPLPPDHAAVLVARTGALATRCASALATPAEGIAPGVAPLIEELGTTVDGSLVPLTEALCGVLRERAATRLYLALPDLLAGFSEEARSFAREAAAQHEAQSGTAAP